MLDDGGTGAPATMCELFKLLRNQWLSRHAIGEALGLHPNTVYRWFKQLRANGFVIEHEVNPTQSGGGHPTVLFSLSPAWGGAASDPIATDGVAP